MRKEGPYELLVPKIVWIDEFIRMKGNVDMRVRWNAHKQLKTMPANIILKLTFHIDYLTRRVDDEYERANRIISIMFALVRISPKLYFATDEELYNLEEELIYKRVEDYPTESGIISMLGKIQETSKESQKVL
ncbi:MAG: hypothetical protein Q4C44_00380 [bacterium]|nr:hypothetical protein [bacterium]